MKIWAALNEAVTGWIAIVRGGRDWARHFSLSMAGLVTALVLFVFFALLSVALASANVGMATPIGLVVGILFQAISILALVVGVISTNRAVPAAGPLMTLYVPGIYVLVFYLVAGTLLSQLAGPLLIPLWIMLGFLFYRLGRMAGGWTIGVSIAFAVLTLVLLVGVPMTIYMLLGPVAAPTL